MEVGQALDLSVQELAVNRQESAKTIVAEEEQSIEQLIDFDFMEWLERSGMGYKDEIESQSEAQSMMLMRQQYAIPQLEYVTQFGEVSLYFPCDMNYLSYEQIMQELNENEEHSSRKELDPRTLKTLNETEEEARKQELILIGEYLKVSGGL